jgi:hypothetical protein
MTETWDRPPPDVAPADLFERWLPQALAATGFRAPPGVPILRVSITGSAAAAWDLDARGDNLVVTSAGRASPDIWLRISEADLRVALGAEDPDLPAITPAHWSVRNMLVFEPADVDLVRQVSGRIALEIEGRRRRRWVLDVGFGSAGVTAGRPKTTVRLDAPTFEGLRSGAVAPMQPLLDGRLKIEGDRALAMQLLLLVGSRLSRR